MNSGRRRRRRRRCDGVQVDAVLRVVVVAVVLDRLVLMSARRGRRGRRGSRALQESLDLEQLGGPEKVLQLVLRYGDLSGVDEPAVVG